MLVLLLASLLLCANVIALRVLGDKSTFVSLPRFLKKQSNVITSSLATLWKPKRKPEINLPEKVDVVVVGGGLCGSTAAFYLNRQGYNVLLTEQAPEVGGCVNTKNSKDSLALCAYMGHC